MPQCNSLENCYTFVETIKQNNMKTRKTIWYNLPQEKKEQILDTAKAHPNSMIQLINKLDSIEYFGDLTVEDVRLISMYCDIDLNLSEISKFLEI